MNGCKQTMMMVCAGQGHRVVDGCRECAAATTDGGYMKQFGYTMQFTIDLKRMVHARQSQILKSRPFSSKWRKIWI